MQGVSAYTLLGTESDGQSLIHEPHKMQGKKNQLTNRNCSLTFTNNSSSPFGHIHILAFLEKKYII